VFIALVLVVFAGGILTFSLLPEDKAQPVSATRILPPHAPPGQSFPVLIQVHSPDKEPLSLIIRESIPAGSTASRGVPPITTVNRKDNSLKWISRTTSGESVYAYICQLPAAVTMDQSILFNGTVTLKQDTGEQELILGASSLAVAPYHWADTNRDAMIDDEEILAVYDLYSEIKELQMDRDLIDNIWAGSGYRWDSGSNQYIVQE